MGAGMKVDNIDTPALLVELDAMESNLQRMARFFAAQRCKLRPHFKNHKVPALAQRQLDHGAIGITCATLREAEILVQHGIQNVLIANEVAGESKLERLADLSRAASVVVAVDCESILADMARVQRNRNAKFEVVVDIDIGLNRCGVPPGEPALALAKRAAIEGISVRGIMGYDGQFQAAPPSPERDERVRLESKALVNSAALMQAAGFPCSIVSTGGTGTYSLSGIIPGITDIQAGSYLLMDTRYLGLGAPFLRSLTVLATVISMRGGGRAVLDCGVKALSGERGLSALKDVPAGKLIALHAEHALVEIAPHSDSGIKVGKKLEIWVQYSDATVNLHSRLFGVRHGQVEEIFQIEH